MKLFGKKIGMTRVFDDKGNAIPCTVIAAEKNIVLQIKHPEKDGYHAIQMATEVIPDSKKRNVKKPLLHHFAKAKVQPCRVLFESRVEDSAQYQLGQEIGLEIFNDAAFVDVSGVTKGKGTQGVIKRYGFGGGRASHGNSRYHRGGGSTGMRTTPGRVLPLRKKAGHMGCEKKTMQNLKVVEIDVNKQYMLVRGAIPGPNGAMVVISKSKKKR
jgi:large subunit ribosomal protein L3